MDEKPVLVQLDIQSFQQWVKSGTIRMFRDRLVSPPVQWSGQEGPDHGAAPLAFLIRLPAKYGRALAAAMSPYALVDEVIAISLPTEALTNEWKSRMTNMGEGWLPFCYAPDWFLASPSGVPRANSDAAKPAASPPAGEELTAGADSDTHAASDVKSKATINGHSEEAQPVVEETHEVESDALPIDSRQHAAGLQTRAEQVAMFQDQAVADKPVRKRQVNPAVAGDATLRTKRVPRTRRTG